MNCPNCDWPMVIFTGHWYCRKCGKKVPFKKTENANNTKGFMNDARH